MSIGLNSNIKNYFRKPLNLVVLIDTSGSMARMVSVDQRSDIKLNHGSD